MPTHNPRTNLIVSIQKIAPNVFSTQELLAAPLTQLASIGVESDPNRKPG